jgi:TPP-dependent pyruvate/acetoin dehydrogenase alpha subunit
VPASLKEEWAERDPLLRAAARLRDCGWDDARFADLQQQQTTEVREAWAQAESEPLPPAEHVTHGVYAA